MPSHLLSSDGTFVVRILVLIAEQTGGKLSLDRAAAFARGLRKSLRQTRNAQEE